MNICRVTLSVCGASFMLSVVACNSSPEPSPPADTTIQTSVAETEVALGEVGEDEAETATEPAPTATLTPPQEATIEPDPELAAACEVVTGGLNLRYGPGIVYAPPILVVDLGGQLNPMARNGDGTWIEVTVAETGATGWVSSAGQFVECDVDIQSLPTSIIPPTPTPSPTPPVLTVGAIEGTVNEVVEEKVRLEIEANDPNIGDQNGDGIDFVTFTLIYDDTVIYGNIDTAAPYCAVPYDPEDDRCFYFFPDPPIWPDGTPIENGIFIVRAIVNASNGVTETVESEFEVDLP